MKISVIKETAENEVRVALLPDAVRELVDGGHEVLVEKNAAYGLGVYDKDYEAAGAHVTADRRRLYGESDLVVKLKAPTMQEFPMLDGNVLFSMLHHEQNPDHVSELAKRNAVAVEMESIFTEAKERVVDATDITGEVGVLYAAQHLKVMPQDAQVLVLGYGRVGSGAITMANRLGMKVKILRKEEYSHIEHFLTGKDLLVNAISWPAEERAKKNYLVTREMLDRMNPYGVVLDLAVDYPNPIQTCRPTSLSNPWYVEADKVHIGIYGYPGLVPVTCARRYSAQILSVVKEIVANGGVDAIGKRGTLGKAIEGAVVDPERLKVPMVSKKDFEKSFTE